MTEWLSVIIAGIATLIGLGSLYFTHQEWRKINRKIGMISDATQFGEVLPAWYSVRMGQDHWMFGLITTAGKTIAITTINAVSDDGKWMDVELAEPGDTLPEGFGEYVIAVDRERTTASVQISTIVAAVDLWRS